jgi:hypothetical protein
MGAEKIGAKIAAVKVCAHMGAVPITARIVAGLRFVNMGNAETSARNAAEVPYVCINGSPTRARFAVRNVPMAKRRVSVRFVLMNAKRFQFAVHMGTKKTNAVNAEVKLCAHMAKANINANHVGERNTVCIIESEISARIVMGSPYVVINARFTGALFVVLDVPMAKKAVDAKFVK